MAIDTPRDPDLTTLLQLHGEVLRDSINVMLPGKIVSYDAGKQMATVQALVKHRHLAEDGETYVVEDLPPIHNVPVEFCGPARGRITWPTDVSDLCEIRFASSSLARWILTNPGNTVDPGDDRRHDITDAVCFVGLHSPASAPTDAPQDAICLHVSDGVVIKLGSSGAANNVQTTLDVADFMIALAAAITASVGSPQGAAALGFLQTNLMALVSGPNMGKAWGLGSSKVLADP